MTTTKRPPFPSYPSIADRLRERIFVLHDDDADDPEILAQLENFIENFMVWRWEAEKDRGFGQRAIWDGESAEVARARENMCAAFNALEKGAS